jgi:hypothetical protein
MTGVNHVDQDGLVRLRKWVEPELDGSGWRTTRSLLHERLE